jgi:hypothetical protein
LWNVVKTVIRGRLAAVIPYIRKEQAKSMIYRSTLRSSEKPKQNQLIEPKVSRRKEVIKTGVEINEIKQTIKKSQQSQKLVL